MNRLYLFLFLSMIILLMSCNSKPKVPQQIFEEEQRATTMPDHPITDMLYAELDSSEVYNDSILYGYWFKPHEASSVNIFFHKDNTYEFNYYEVNEDDKITDLLKKGTFTFDGEVITLSSDEGWDDYFNGVMYYKHNGTNHYLTDKTNIFNLIKGSD